MKKLSLLIALMAFITILGNPLRLLAADKKWFIEPSAAIVIPDNSSIIYHGMPGTVKYSNGQSFGFNAGRNLKRFKLYVSYSYTEFRAQETTILTPFGPQTNSDQDLYHSHAVLGFIEFRSRPLLFGLQASASLGVGGTFDKAVSPTVEGRLGLVKRLGRVDVELSYANRWVSGTQASGNISVKEPSQQRISLSLNFKF